MYFPSKKDWWMTIIIWLFAGIFIITPIFFPDMGVWMTPEFLDRQWIKILVLTPIGVVLMWIWLKTGYTIEARSLIVQYGPLKKIIMIDDIYRIRETKNPSAAPSLSMHKIEIYYGKYDFIAISPKDQPALVSQLRELNPNITTDEPILSMK